MNSYAHSVADRLPLAVPFIVPQNTLDVLYGLRDSGNSLHPLYKRRAGIIGSQDQGQIPIECIHSNDSISYVFLGSDKQQVILGKNNENEIITSDDILGKDVVDTDGEILGVIQQLKHR